MSDTDAEHGLAKLPEISSTNAEPHLAAHQLVKVEVRYPCLCGAVIRTSEAIPETVLMNVDQFADKVRQITAQSRARWEEHLRG